MTTKITEEIIGYKLVESDIVAPTTPPPETTSMPDVMGEKIERPDRLHGVTYKIAPPVMDHAMYITINDIILNQGSEHEQRVPYEIFLQSKSVDQFQWISALMRLASAVFRKGGDITFMVDELKNTFDPKGGYFRKGTYMNSVVGEIGHVVEEHLSNLGSLNDVQLSDEQEKFIAEKRASLGVSSNDNGFPSNSTLCGACGVVAMIKVDGCNACLNCADSKCG